MAPTLDLTGRGNYSSGIPTQKELEGLLVGTTSVRVREVGARPRIHFESDQEEVIRGFRETVRIRDGGIGHCMCSGSLVIEFRSAGSAPCEITVHHGESIRYGKYWENAALENPEGLIRRLSHHGVTALADERAENLRRNAQQKADADRWRAAMPACLTPFWTEMVQPVFEWPKVEAFLAEQYPDPLERARILLDWFGHGAGPWSGHPVYECVPEWILIRMPLATLAEACRKEPRSRALLDGAVRLFAGWHFGKARKKDLKRLPPALLEDLRRHTLNSSLEDPREAFQRTLAWIARTQSPKKAGPPTPGGPGAKSSG